MPGFNRYEQLTYYPGETTQLRSEYSLIFSILLVAGALTTPVAGWVIDRWGLATGGLLSVGLSWVYGACLLIPSQAALIPAFVSYVLWRTFVRGRSFPI